MKRLILLFVIVLSVNAGWSQKANEARKILDKTAAVLSSKGGAKANFRMTGCMGNVSGSVSIKGNKFNAYTPSAIVWYDGRTQWTYMKRTQEVNVSNPTEAQQQSMNPYKFLYIYKNGYSMDMKSTATGWKVHLKAYNQARTIKEMYIDITKKYQLNTVKMRQSGGWTTISVSGFRKASLPDSQFRFNAKDYPNAEVIDLR